MVRVGACEIKDSKIPLKKSTFFPKVKKFENDLNCLQNTFQTELVHPLALSHDYAKK